MNKVEDHTNHDICKHLIYEHAMIMQTISLGFDPNQDLRSGKQVRTSRIAEAIKQKGHHRLCHLRKDGSGGVPVQIDGPPPIAARQWLAHSRAREGR